MEKVKVDNPVTVNVKGCAVDILATAHISNHFANQVKRLIENNNYDVVGVELCEKRYDRYWAMGDIKNHNFDVKHKFLTKMVNKSLYKIQKGISKEKGHPRTDMIIGIEEAVKNEIPFYLLDQDIDKSTQKMFDNMKFYNKLWFLTLPILSKFMKSDNSDEKMIELVYKMLYYGSLRELLIRESINKDKGKKDIERTKRMVNKLFRWEILYNLEKYLVEDRNEIIYENMKEMVKGKDKVLVVLGAAHVPGIIKIAGNDKENKNDTT